MKSRCRTPRTRRRWLRGWVFRLAAAALGLAPFVLAEGALVLFDWGRPDDAGDPFLGFAAVRPLFVLSPDNTRYEIARARQEFFCPESFAARKAADEFRIFCLGGSTVQGRPFAVETAFTTWLELALAEAQPDRKWEAVNCGGISYASYRLVPILAEVLDYEPDLIVLYTGHNEFLEERTYAHIKRLPGAVSLACAMLCRTRIFGLLSRGIACCTGRTAGDGARGRPLLAAEVDALLEYRDGLQQYHRDEKRRRDAIDHFRYNLARMQRMARAAAVPLLLVNPVSNLRDCPPFKNQHGDGLGEEQVRQFRSLLVRAGELQATNVYQVVQAIEQAIAVDPQHAAPHYAAAKCYDALGQTKQAKAAYVRAKELDVCPLRILEPMHEAIAQLARDTDAELVDVRALFEGLSEGGIPGDYLLVDHVHPSIVGHQLIANALLERMIWRGMVRPAPGWQDRRDVRFRAHLESLGDLYFAKGQEQLEVLRCWTQGKAPRLRPAPGGGSGSDGGS